MQIPKIAITVAVYNLEKHLDRFFDCLSKQTFTDYEVVMTDDGSQDDSLAICRRYAEKDDRIRVFALEHAGVAEARNFALGQIRAEFATSLDGDDYFDENYLKHLIDAQKKYDADMVISNVIFEKEDGTEIKRFSVRAEAFFSGDDLWREVPALLTEQRLNFLYGKLYRSELLRDIRVEPDVKQGEDTMIVFMYLTKIQSAAVIEDYDYHYIKYTKRTVTSYKGDEAFSRLFRINRTVYDIAEAAGRLDDELIKAIDARVLYSAVIVFNFIASSDAPYDEKLAKICEITHSEEYHWSYDRQKELGNLDKLGVTVIVPGTEKYYLRSHLNPKKAQRIKALREKCPDGVFRIYHKIKVRLGKAPDTD